MTSCAWTLYYKNAGLSFQLFTNKTVTSIRHLLRKQITMPIQFDHAVRSVEGIISYHFNDPYFVLEAVSAAGSLTFGGSRRFPDGNKRLAILGDTVLQLVLAGDWYDGAAPRAAYDRIRQQVASNQNLNQIGNTNGLNAFVILAGAQAGQSTIPPATMAATVEAIIGAVYLDSNNMSTVMAVMSTLGLIADPATGDLSAAW